MRNILLLLILIVSSCAPKKYGCGLAKTKTTLRGYGTVSVVDTSCHPYMYLIRVGGRIVKNDSILIEAKYVLAHEGKFTSQLKNRIGDTVFFECTSVNSKYTPKEILDVIDGHIRY